MNLNAFHDIGKRSEMAEPPSYKRVYARIDQVEIGEFGDGPGGVPPLPGSGPVLYLDSIDANWFDDNRRRPGGGADADTRFFMDARLCVIEARADNFDRFKVLDRDDLEEADESEWLEIVFETAAEGAALVYRNLFSVPTPINLSSVRRVTGSIKQRLDKELSLDDVSDATQEDIEDALAKAGQIDHAVVYDVGQGSSAGLCNSVGRVVVYCDFGGGVLRHTTTFPPGLNLFCMCASAPIILSHWDWDHWSSASRDTRAYNCKWIAPRQKMGPVHRTAAFQMASGAGLLIWPHGLASISSGQITIDKCTRTGTSRNDTGLAVTVAKSGNPSAPRLLFTGDADYSFIPPAQAAIASATADFIAIVAPHHGGKMRTRSAPLRPKAGHARVAYSYGISNMYRHGVANCQARLDHVKANWNDRHVTVCAVPPEFARQTEDRGPASKLGHIRLGWSAVTSAVTPQCVGTTNCDLEAEQI